MALSSEDRVREAASLIGMPIPEHDIKEIAARFAALIESFRSLDDLELQHALPYHTDLSEVQYE